MVVNCQGTEFSQNFVNLLKVPYINICIKKFADTELYINLENTEQLEGFDVLIPYQFFLFDKNDIDRRCLHDQIAGLIILTDFLKKLKVKSISVVIPYLPYSRQERSFDGNVVGPISLLGNILRVSGIEKVFSCDLHSPDVLRLFGSGLFEVDMSLFWKNYFKSDFAEELGQNKLCIISPDAGGFQRAKSIANSLNVPVICLEKKRIGVDKSVALKFDGNVMGKVVVILDDIIDTGETAVHACDLLKKEGASKVIGMFTHPVFASGSIDYIVNSNFDCIYVSNTIPVHLNFKKDKIFVKSVDKFLIEKVLRNLK